MKQLFHHQIRVRSSYQDHIKLVHLVVQGLSGLASCLDAYINTVLLFMFISQQYAVLPLFRINARCVDNRVIATPTQCCFNFCGS